MNSHFNFCAHTHQTPNRRAPLGLFALILGLCAVLSLSGCVGLTGAGKPATKSNSAATASAGTLAANTSSLNFGNVAMGSSSVQTLTLMNTGTAAVTISQAAVTGASFSVVGGMSSFSISAGQDQAFQVQFAPKASGSASGSISIVSDAANSPLNVSLSGSASATLAITAQPLSQSVKVGQAADFSVVATGPGALTYQWKKNGAAIGGATGASYITPAATLADSGTQFSVVVSDGSGSISSSVAMLTVTSSAVAPSIVTQPSNSTVAAGQAATFAVTATGTAPLMYQWKKNGAPIGGATAASYTTAPTTPSDSGAQFTVTVTNSVSSVTSNAAGLTVNLPPSITAQPVSQTVNAGQSATFHVGATGTGTLSYQWKRNGSAIGGATLASYTTPATSASDNGAQFSVTVTDLAGSVTSNAAFLTVNAVSSAPSITSQPSSRTVNAGQTATFSVGAQGTGTLTYQWKKGGTAISGATSSSYTTPATTTADNGAQFSVTVTNGVGSVTSNSATLTVNAAATLILNANQTSLNFSSVNIGSNSTLPVTLTNGGNSNVTISNVMISGAGYTASGAQSGQIVTPGHTATLNVTLTPSSAGPLPGGVTIASNATNSPVSVTLSGTGVQQAVPHSVALTWTASTSVVSGYNVYSSTVTGGPYTKLNSTPVASTGYTDSTVQSGLTYFYVVTSVDSNGVESAFSAEVSATVP